MEGPLRRRRDDDRACAAGVPQARRKEDRDLSRWRAWEPASPLVDSALVKALARAFRWRRLLDDGVYGTLDDLAKAERVSQGYVSRVLRLTLLAPEIVEAILDGRQPEAMRLDDLLAGVSGGVGGADRMLQADSMKAAYQSHCGADFTA